MSTDSHPARRTIVVVASLKPGAQERARALVREGPPFDPAAFGLARHTVYLSPHEVVFLFEAPDADVHVADIVDDMAVSASFAAWAPLLSGTPRLAHQAYCWEEAPRALGVR